MGHHENGHRLFGADMLADPYPEYAALRTQAPVQWNALANAWILTSHEAVSQVLKSRSASADRVTGARLRFPTQYQPAFDVLSRIMIQVDEPQHRHLRDLVHSAFTRTAVQDYEPKIRALCEELLAPGLARGEMEFMSEFAIPLPILVISEIVGVPPEDRKQIKEWCDSYSFLILNFYLNITEEQLAECAVKLQEFCDYLKDKVAAVAKSPRDDLISSLTLAAEQDEMLSVEDVVANCILLLNAGNETTACLLGTGMRLMMAHPDQQALLRAQPDLIPNAVEEFLRFDAPVQLVGRVATEEVVLAGETIAEGDLMLTVLAAANRDPEAFDNPDVLDVARTHSHQLGFGTGTHMCAGIQLARFEAQLAFRFLLEKLAQFELLTDTLEYSPNFNLRALQSLPIKVKGT